MAYKRKKLMEKKRFHILFFLKAIAFLTSSDIARPDTTLSPLITPVIVFNLIYWKVKITVIQNEMIV